MDVDVPINWIKVTCLLPAEAYGVFDAAREKLRVRGLDHEREEIRNGLALEALAAEYLASP